MEVWAGMALNEIVVATVVSMRRSPFPPGLELALQDYEIHIGIIVVEIALIWWDFDRKPTNGGKNKQLPKVNSQLERVAYKSFLLDKFIRN